MGRNRGLKNGRTIRPQASLGGSPEIEMSNISCLGLLQFPWRAASGPARCGTRGPQHMHHNWPPPILAGRLVRKRKPFQVWELRVGYPTNSVHDAGQFVAQELRGVNASRYQAKTSVRGKTRFMVLLSGTAAGQNRQKRHMTEKPRKRLTQK